MNDRNLLNVEPSSERVREAGLGYNFSALKDDVISVLEEGVKNLIPLEESSEMTMSKYLETITADKNFTITMNRPRHSITTITTLKLEEAWRRLAAEKSKAKAVEEVLMLNIQKAIEISRKVDLYIATADAIKRAVETAQVPKPVQPANTQSNLAAPKSNPTVNSRRTTTFNNNANTRSLLAPASKKGNAKSKAPPPKPEPRFVTTEEFESVSLLVRGKVKLSDVNHAYSVLYEIFYGEMLEKIKLMELAKRGVAVSGMTEMAKLKVLRQLKRITLSSDNQFVTPADFA